MKSVFRGTWLLLLLAPCTATVGCGKSQVQAGGAMPPPEVSVSLPVTREVIDYEDFPGRMEAVNSVEVRARVTGFLDRVRFREGAEVQEGEVLFDIDPRIYQAKLARAEGSVTQYEGQLKRLEADYQRVSNLLPSRAANREEFDKIVGDREVALGSLGIARAEREEASLNVGFTKVRAPVAGRISRKLITPGNLVKENETALTTIVSLDPIYAYFDLDERTTLRFQRLIREGKIGWSTDTRGLPLFAAGAAGWLAAPLGPGALLTTSALPPSRVAAPVPVLLGLADEKGYSREGTIDFADNHIDPDTGTWQLRALFKNPDHALSPGLFVRVRLPIGSPYRAMLVSEQALGTDQGQKYVYVVETVQKNEKGETKSYEQVAYRRVKVGRLHQGLRVISSGLSDGDRVVVSGLQRVRPGSEVTPQLLDHMPVVEDEASAEKETRKQGDRQKAGPGH